MSRSGLVLAVGQASEAALPLLRSVVLARLLAGSDFGIAVALTAFSATIEVSADIGLDRLAVLAGASDEAQARRDVLHAISVLRGFLVGAVLFALGPVVAILIHAPDSWLAFSALGVSSAMRGFAHFGAKEAMQRYSFWQEGLATLTAQVAWTIATVAMALIRPDYWCMVVGMLISQACYVSVTHAMGRHRWRPRWSKTLALEAWKYGSPLIPNGLALVASSMVDRIVVAAFLGVEPMAVYYTAVTAAALPRGVILRFMNNIALPAFVNRKEHPETGTRAFDAWFLALALVAFSYAVGFASLGAPAIGLVFGAKLEPSQVLVSLVSLSVFMRYMYTLPVPPAMAQGKTRFILGTTLAMSCSLITGIAALATFHRAEAFVAGVFATELVATSWTLRRSLIEFPFGRGFAFRCLVATFPLLVAIAVAKMVLPAGVIASAVALILVYAIVATISYGLARRIGIDPVQYWPLRRRAAG